MGGPRVSALRERRRIALVAHDHKKQEIIEWARYNQALLEQHELFATGTTGSLLREQLGLPVERLKSGPLGGDLQLGAMIAEGRLDILVFFWDPLESQPHDVDVKALLRICVVYNVPVACNRASADYLISSPLMVQPYERVIPRYDEQREERVPAALGEPESERRGNRGG
ncbi:MAG: methylglyoxal synthase [bacterium]